MCPLRLRCITEVRSSQAQLGRFLKGGLLPADSEASSKIGGAFFLFRKGCNRLQPESFDVQFERLFPFAQVKHKKQGPLCRQSVIFEIPNHSLLTHPLTVPAGFQKVSENEIAVCPPRAPPSGPTECVPPNGRAKPWERSRPGFKRFLMRENHMPSPLVALPPARGARAGAAGRGAMPRRW